MSNVIAMKPNHAEEIRDKLKEAEARAGEFERVLILMETEDGKLDYFANDEMTVSQVNWLIDRMKFHVLDKGWR